MVFKSLNGPAPEYLSSKFIGRPDNTPYAFRDSANIVQDTINKYCKIKSGTAFMDNRVFH